MSGGATMCVIVLSAMSVDLSAANTAVTQREVLGMRVLKRHRKNAGNCFNAGKKKKVKPHLMKKQLR